MIYNAVVCTRNVRHFNHPSLSQCRRYSKSLTKPLRKSRVTQHIMNPKPRRREAVPHSSKRHLKYPRKTLGRMPFPTRATLETRLDTPCTCESSIRSKSGDDLRSRSRSHKINIPPPRQAAAQQSKTLPSAKTQHPGAQSKVAVIFRRGANRRARNETSVR